MLAFTSDQWIIIALVFLLGLLVGGFLFAGSGRKWKTRYREESRRREDIEKSHRDREREWDQRDKELRERDSVRGSDVRDRDGDGIHDDRDPKDDRDRDGDGIRDDRQR